LLSYAPPPPGNATQYGYSDLYLLAYAGAGELRSLTIRSDPQESFFFSAWAPDGQLIYCTHLYRIDPDSPVPAYQNNVVALTLDGQARVLVDHALWPAVSPDGGRLAYLSADPESLSNDLYLANADGSEQMPVLQPGENPPVDAHLFNGDGHQLIFSMVNLQPLPVRNWLDRLLGVQVASAHSVPSDWYRLPVEGGTPQRLTNLEDLNLNGDLSPDGSRLAFIGASGLYVLDLDGGNLIQLAKANLIGSVDWAP
jgi:Tol biopolymer transport system component